MPRCYVCDNEFSTKEVLDQHVANRHYPGLLLNFQAAPLQVDLNAPPIDSKKQNDKGGKGKEDGKEKASKSNKTQK